MGHSSSEVGVLKKFKEVQTVWIPVTDHKNKEHKNRQDKLINSHDELDVLWSLPVLKILQVFNKRFIFKIPILCQVCQNITQKALIT